MLFMVLDLDIMVKSLMQLLEISFLSLISIRFSFSFSLLDFGDFLSK